MLKELAIGAAVLGGAWFLLFRKAGAAVARGLASGVGADRKSSWELVTGDAPTRVNPSTGKPIPIWYFNAPVDPSDRWAGLVVSHNKQGFPAPIIVVVVRKTAGPSPAPVGSIQAAMLEIISPAAGDGGTLTGKVIADPSPQATALLPLNLQGDDGFAPEIGTEIVFTPSDVILQVQP